MKTFGLIGHRLGYSFSKNFFTEKFHNDGLSNHEYRNFELDSINEFPNIFESNKNITGLNCTIPYKEQIIQYLDEIDEEAAQIGAVNTVKIIKNAKGQIIKGYNTDTYGFENSLKPMLNSQHTKALILGTGGAAKAIKFVFDKLNIQYITATRKDELLEKQLNYNSINDDFIKEHQIIINATPLGTYPNIDSCPNIPYEALTENHVLFDLVYNPEVTLFMKKGIERGARVKNGLEMLHLQALKAWEIWNA